MDVFNCIGWIIYNPKQTITQDGTPCINDIESISSSTNPNVSHFIWGKEYYIIRFQCDRVDSPLASWQSFINIRIDRRVFRNVGEDACLDLSKSILQVSNIGRRYSQPRKGRIHIGDPIIQEIYSSLRHYNINNFLVKSCLCKSVWICFSWCVKRKQLVDIPISCKYIGKVSIKADEQLARRCV